MGRRALVRGATAAAVSLILAVGLGSLTVGSAHGEPVTADVAVPATTALLPRTSLLGAGPSGILRYEHGRGRLWTTYDGVDTVVDASGTPSTRRWARAGTSTTCSPQRETSAVTDGQT
ncbi:hypothetical protein ACWCPM_31010 [Streptomyces sp. NPDC002309]